MIALLNTSALGFSLVVLHDKAKRTGKSANREPTHDLYVLVNKKVTRDDYTREGDVGGKKGTVEEPCQEQEGRGRPEMQEEKLLVHQIQIV